MDHPGEYFHGLALALKIRAARNGEPMESADMIQERALALDDAEAGRRLFLKQRELEEITEDPLETDIIKKEAARELMEIYAFQKKNVSRTNSLAQKASDSVGKAIKRLYAHLSKAADKSGQPHSMLRAFAQEVRDHILVPSGRAIGHGGMRIQAEAGFFVFVQPIQTSAEKEN